MTLGSYPSMGLAEARREADLLRGDVAAGRDPGAEKTASLSLAKTAASANSMPTTLLPLLELYGAHLARRDVRDRKNVISALRRRLAGSANCKPAPIGNLPIDSIRRNDIMRIVSGLEAQGMPGAARSFRQKATTFLNWAAQEGLLDSNPLAGMRGRRATRAERVERRDRMLKEEELALIWRACRSMEAGSHGARVLGAIVRILMLTGQRRTETARMRFEDLDERWEWWTIPAAEAKNGVAHKVPLPEAARTIIAAQPRYASCNWVFTTDGLSPVSGWSKLLPKLRKAAESDGMEGSWTLHDLRRSFRSGLTRLRVDSELAEIMLNHRPERLRSIYDLEPRLEERREAAEAWAAHLTLAVGKAAVAELHSTSCDSGSGISTTTVPPVLFEA